MLWPGPSRRSSRRDLGARGWSRAPGQRREMLRVVQLLGQVGSEPTAPAALQATLLSGAGVCLLIQFDPPGVFPCCKVTTPFQRGEK